MAEPLIFPVGHNLGAVHGEGPVTHRVRVGPDFLKLSTAAFRTWDAARGDGTGAGRPWTRSDTELAARARGVTKPGAAIDALLAEGLLAEVTPEGAADFARGHRLVPLLLGLGRTTDDPEIYELGLFGWSAAAGDLAIEEIWELCGTATSLWAVADRVAAEDDSISPAEAAELLLYPAHGWLAAGAAHWDLAIMEAGR